MKKQHIEIWKEAQQNESAFWKSREKQGLALSPVSLDRYRKCMKLFPLSLCHLTRILDVGSGPYGGVPFFIKKQCFKVSCDPLVGRKGEFLYKEVNKEVNSVQAIGEYLPFGAETFDFAFCVNALDHSYRPLYILNELRRVLKRDKGVLIMMVHVVTSLEKIVHSIICKTRFRKVLSASSYVRFYVRSFLRLMLRFNVMDDSILHPFYFALNDVVNLLNQAGFTINEIKLCPSPWNYKEELFVIARKQFTG